MATAGGTIKVAVVGAGYVGLSTAVSLAHGGHRVAVLEQDPSRVATLQRREDPLGERGMLDLLAAVNIEFTTNPTKALRDVDAIVIAVGTPTTQSGAADLSSLRAAVRTVAETSLSRTVLIRSTVPVGTCDELQAGPLRGSRVVANPEFLREGHAVAEALTPDRIVAGGDEDANDLVRALYRPILDQTWAPVGALQPAEPVPFLWMDRRSAELAKYAANAYLVTRLSFVNEISNVAAAAGADVRAVLKALALDPRIGPSYLRPGLGWGGSCFPKDARALLSFTTGLGYDFTLLRAVIDQNNQQLVRFLGLVIGSVRPGGRLALLGLAFKGGTRDTRQSPATALAELLLQQGFEIRAYDPMVRGPVPSVPGLAGLETLAEAVDGADAVVIATEWPEFASLDLAWLASAVRQDAVVIDGRCILDARAVISAGLRYLGVCPPAPVSVD